MKVIRRIPPFLRNKFFLAIAFFVVWMMFFDKNDLFTQLERRRELQEIEEGKTYYEKEIKENKEFTSDLKTNSEAIEKFAREKYLMKRENEDIFLVEKASRQ